MELHGPDGGPSLTSSDSGSVHNWCGGALSPQPAKERKEDVKLHGPDGGPSPTSSDSSSEHLIDDQQPGGALSPQPAKEREEDVEMHGQGGPSPASSDSGSVHIWPLPHKLRLRLCTHLAVHFLLNLPRRGRRMWSCMVWMEASLPPA
jgi:hypothetical protein